MPAGVAGPAATEEAAADLAAALERALGGSVSAVCCEAVADLRLLDPGSLRMQAGWLGGTPAVDPSGGTLPRLRPAPATFALRCC